MEKKFLPPLENLQVSCLCCGSAGKHLSMDTVLYMGFGGWTIERNGELYFIEEPNKEFEEMKTLVEIEKEAALSPDDDWRAVAYMPLHGETYQRQNDKWVLVEQNEGFA